MSFHPIDATNVIHLSLARFFHAECRKPPAL
jgi:hypothetical protein